MKRRPRGTVWEILKTTPPRFAANSIVLTSLICQGLGSIMDSLARLMESSVRRLLEDKQTAEDVGP